MHIKTYLEPTIEQALKCVRNEFGADAIIISTVNEGHLVRITAAGESLQPAKKSITSVVKSDLNYDQWLALFKYHRIPAVIIDHIAQLFLNQLAASQVLSLQNILSPYVNQHFLEPKSLILMGASGIGKSLTLAKLASEYRLKKIPVCIITCDPFKAGAIEQMQKIAGIQDVQVYVAENYHELDQLIKQQSIQYHCLIDTPGVNPTDSSDYNLIQDFLTFSQAEPILVLSAGVDACEHIDHIEAFKVLGVCKFIMTKIDTVKRYGNLMTTLVHNHLSLIGWTVGNTLGHRIIFPTVDDVTDLLIKNYQTQLIVPALKSHPKLQKPTWPKATLQVSS